MTTDRIALLRLPDAYIATRDALALVQGDSTEEVIANLYKTAPDVKAVYFYPQTYSYKHINETVGALEIAGFKNVKLVNSSSWYETEQLHRLQNVKWDVGDWAAFLFPNDTLSASVFSIYEKTVDGFFFIGDNEYCAFDQLNKCEKLKNLIVSTTDHDFSESKKLHLTELFTAHYVHFVGNEGQNWLKCIWDEHDGKVENFLPAPFTLNVRFKYGNSWHMEKVNYSELPFKKVFDLDIDNAAPFEILTSYNSSSSAEKFYSRKFEGTDSLVLKITLTVGYDFIPEVDFICERYDVKGVVYFIDSIFEYDTKKDYFTASIITAEGTQKVVDENYVISDVFKELEAKRGTAKLRGVFVPFVSLYYDYDDIIHALPSPDTKVCVAQTHSDWAIHLRNSGVQVPVGEAVVITDWSFCAQPYYYYYLRKTSDGFQVVEKSSDAPPDLPFSTIIVIVSGYTSNWKMPDPVEKFSSKKVIVSKTLGIQKKVLHDYAWQFFNGMDFYGCMVQPYRGVTFNIKNKNSDVLDSIDLVSDCNCGTFEKNISYLHDDPNENLTVSLCYVGYGEHTVCIVQTPTSGYIHLKLSIDDKLVPKVTVTESSSPILPRTERNESARNELETLEPEADRIAILDLDEGFVATRDKLIKFTTDYRCNVYELIQEMYRAAPDVKVIYFSPTCFVGGKYVIDNKYKLINKTIAALKYVGYKNVQFVNTNSWVYTEFVHQSSIALPIGECLVIPYGGTKIYEKTVDGYALVSTLESCLQNCQKIKHILIPLHHSEHSSDKFWQYFVETYQSQKVHFVQSSDSNWLKCMWDAYDGNVENFLPAPFTLNVYFKYGNAVHLEKVEHCDHGSVKTFVLNIDDARKLDIDVNYDGFENEHLKSYKFGAGKSRVLKVTLKVGREFVPEITVAIESEVNTVKGVVYSVDFNQNTNRFIGTLIEDGSHTTVEDSANVSDVFKQLDDKKGTRKLKGVYVDYPSYNVFPLDVHRSVVQSLPTPNTKLYFGRPHSEWTIHLWNSRVQLKVGERVIITNWTPYASKNKIFGFKKTVDGFCFYNEVDPKSIRDYCAFIVIVEEKTTDYEKLAQQLYPSKTVTFSERSKLPKNVGNDFAWHYCNGLNFYGYMVEPYYGVSFVMDNGYRQNNKFSLPCDRRCGSFRCNMAFNFNEWTSLNFSVLMCCAGFAEMLTLIDIPMSYGAFAVINICMDEKLLPIITLTENSPLLTPKLALRGQDIQKLLPAEHASDSNLIILDLLEYVQVDYKL